MALPTVAAIVHFETTGIPHDASKPAETRDVLNYVAHAISNVVPIYASHQENGNPIEISIGDLLGAKFLRGAHLLITKGGKEYRGLVVQRRDMNTAIVILKRAGFAIK